MKAAVQAVILFSFLPTIICGQIATDWPFHKVSIPFVRIISTTPIKAFSKNTGPGYPYWNNFVTVGYSYLIEITISISGNKNEFTEEVPILVKTPDGEQQVFIFNKDKFPLRSNRLYDFVFTVEMKFDGYTQIGILRKFSNSNEYQFQIENTLDINNSLVY